MIEEIKESCKLKNPKSVDLMRFLIRSSPSPGCRSMRNQYSRGSRIDEWIWLLISLHFWKVRRLYVSKDQRKCMSLILPSHSDATSQLRSTVGWSGCASALLTIGIACVLLRRRCLRWQVCGRALRITLSGDGKGTTLTKWKWSGLTVLRRCCLTMIEYTSQIRGHWCSSGTLAWFNARHY